MCAAPLVERRKDRIECSASCGFVNYDNPTPVAAVVVEFEDKIVLAHNRSWSGAFNGLIIFVSLFVERALSGNTIGRSNDTSGRTEKN